MSRSPKTTTAPTGSIAPFGLRMLPELKMRLEAAAKAAGRSMNAEIVDRLQGSFEVNEGVPEFIMEALEDAAGKWGIPLEEAHGRIILAGVNKDAPQVIVINAKGGMTVAEMRKLFEVAKDSTSPDATVYFERE